MNLAQYKAIAATLNKDLEEVFKKHGLNMFKLSARVDSGAGSVRYSIEARDTSAKTETGAQLTPERRDYEQLAAAFNLDPKWLDQSFKYGGKDFKVIGLKPRKTKNPVVVQRADGKQFVVPVEVIRLHFMAKEKA